MLFSAVCMLQYLENNANPVVFVLNSSFVPDGSKEVAISLGPNNDDVMIEYIYHDIIDYESLTFTSRAKMKELGFTIADSFGDQCYSSDSSSYGFLESDKYRQLIPRVFICAWSNERMAININVIIDELASNIDIEDKGKMACHKCKISMYVQLKGYSMIEWIVGMIILLAIQAITILIYGVISSRLMKTEHQEYSDSVCLT